MKNLSYIQALLRQGSNDFNVTTGEGRFEQYMEIGYGANDKKDYHTALINFGRAFNLRPGNKYAKEAIHNMERAIRESR